MPVLLGISLILLVSVLVSLGLAATSRSWSDGFLGWISAAFANVPFLGGTLAVEAVRLTRWITNKIGYAFDTLAHPVVGWLGGLTQYVATVAEWSLLWPIELFRLMTWLVSTEIPALVHALPTRVEKKVTAVTKELPAVTKIIYKFPKLSRAQAKAIVAGAIGGLLAPYLYPLRWLRAHFHALTAVIPHTLPIPFGRTIAQIKKRLRALEHTHVGALAFAGAVAIALARLGLTWVRCEKVGKLGGRICKLGPRALNDLLGLLADALFLTNICRAFSLLNRGLGVVQPEITAFITAAETWACYGDNEKPPRLTPPPLDLPRAVGVSGLPV